MILVSACLAGLHTKYDGGSNPVPAIVELVRSGRAIPVCPEQLGGLATPRPPAEMVGGDGHQVWSGLARVLTGRGDDVTTAFRRGAQEVLALARLTGCTGAVLKEGSPSCGVNRVYNGTFSGVCVSGSGVTTVLLQRNGFTVRSEREWLLKAGISASGGE